jgi:AcrR family transcriptional regulator
MAQALGVTHATLIRHFRSKDNLIHEVVDRIRQDFFTALEETYQLRDATTVRQFLDTAWALLKHPTEQRQFLLLFEVVALATRHPDSLGDISYRIVQEWLAPLEELLVTEGRSAEEATTIATLALAQVRGLQLDLLLSGERSRADAAFELAMTQLPRPSLDRA